MPIKIVYRCWGCEQEKVEFEPSEDPTRSEIIIWNLCSTCIRKNEDDLRKIQAEANKVEAEDFSLRGRKC